MSAIARHEHEWEKTNRDFNYRAVRDGTLIMAGSRTCSF